MSKKRKKGRGKREVESQLRTRIREIESQLVGGDLPLNLLGIASYQELLDAATKLDAAKHADEVARKAVRDELDRRRDPVQVHVRKLRPTDSDKEVYTRIGAQMKRWGEFYGYYDPSSDHWLGLGPNCPRGDAKIPLMIDMECGEFNSPDGGPAGMLTMQDRENMVEAPLRVLARLEQGKPRIEYLPATKVADDARAAVNAILGCDESDWVGSPPDRVILSPKGEGAHGPIVMTCGYATDTFKSEGPIKGPLTITDLTEEAERAFIKDVLAGDKPRAVSRSDHKAILDFNLLIRSDITKGEIVTTLDRALLWPQVRDAVIFEFPTAAFETLYESYSQHFMGLARAAVGKKASDAEVRQEYERILIEQAAHCTLPDKIPFPACYFAFGAGIRTEFRELDGSPIPKAEGADTGLFVAVVITENRDVLSFVAKYPKRFASRVSRPAFVATAVREGGQWVRPETLLPWIIPTLIEYVNDHKTLVEEGARDFGYRRQVERRSKQLHIRPPVPPPFYVVYLQDKLIQERVRSTIKTSRKIDWQHRWQVRGSWNIRVKRGRLPIDPEVEVELRKRKYQIYAGIPQMPADLADELHRRGIAPRGRDEWLAVLRYWRKAHVKGPEGKPLIESVRRSTKKWGGNDA